MALRGGVVYAVLDGSELVAVDLATGRARWTRESGGESAPSPAVDIAGDEVVTELANTVVCLDRRTGTTCWFREWGDHPRVLPPSSGDGAPLLLRADLPPRVGGIETRTWSVPGVDTLTAVDPRTGRERWRWQPAEGLRIERALQDGDALLLSDGRELFRAVEGDPGALLTEEAARRRLAEDAVAALFQWRPGSGPIRPFRRFPLSTSQETQARLLLLRLGEASIPALLGRARFQLERDEQHLPSAEEVSARRGHRFWREPGSAFELLADLGDTGAAAEMAGWCDRARNPLSRDDLAEALVHSGCRVAAGALFRYARSEAAAPVATCRSALYAAARAGDAPGLKQADVTAFLIDQLRNPAAPAWLRRFALFELLNDRGEPARRAALAAFQREPTGSIRNTTISRRRAPTDEEGIYLATLEALCQLGRTSSVNAERGGLDAVPSALGADASLRLLPAPPGSAGLEMPGHPGVVLRAPERNRGYGIHAGPGSCRFTPPSIGSDGVWLGWEGRNRRPQGPAPDPFAPAPARRERAGRTFREFFPYVLSADGMRARVGWQESYQLVRTTILDFDVEVRKIGGRWTPVECRQIANSWGLPDGLATALRPVR